MYVGAVESLFKCPICESTMHTVEFKSLICANHHTFDFTKQGSLNLLKQPVRSNYGKELFEYRRKLIVEDKFFAPLSEKITEVMEKQVMPENEELFLLDTGTGEGSHFNNICTDIQSSVNKSVIGIGIDISKEGIQTAAKHYSNKIWCVADLANMPFKDQQFDVILNILSPSNYSEFNRLLKANGLVIKVVPRNGYLQELREAFFDAPEKHLYSNAETVNRFNMNFQIQSSKQVRYTVNLDKASLASLVHMTPLAWSASKEKVRLFLEKESVNVTVDLDILIGRKTS